MFVVPSLCMYLIFIRCPNMLGLTFTFSLTFCAVQDSCTCKTIGVGSRHETLYHLGYLYVPHTSSAFVFTMSHAEMWHRCLSHPLSQETRVTDPLRCFGLHPCIECKMTKFTTMSIRTSKYILFVVFELVHFDI